MIGALLLAAALALLSVVGVTGAALLRLSGGWALLGAYVIGWGALVLATTALSIPQVLDRWSLLASIAVLAVGSAAAWVASGRPSVDVVRFAVSLRGGARDPVVLVLGIGAAIGVLYALLLTLFTLPNDWDGLTYHTTRALLWNQHGGVGIVDEGNEPRLNGNPPIAEIGIYLTMAVPRSERFAAVPAYLALLTSTLAVAGIARRFGSTRESAAFGALVFVTFPIVVLHGPGLFNDLVVASFLLIATGFLLSPRRTELAVGALALGLALGTKFSAVLAMPVLLVALAAILPRDRWLRPGVATVAGVGLGSIWYVINLAETGALDAGLSEATGQVADHAPSAVLSTFRALAWDLVSLPGMRGDDLWLPAIAALVALNIVALDRVRRGGHLVLDRDLLLGGVVAGVLPFVLPLIDTPAKRFWEASWVRLGSDEIAFAHPRAWGVSDAADSSFAWYGPVGLLVATVGIVLVASGIRQGRTRRGVLGLALAPLIGIMVLAATIPYDPWRGRLLMFAMGLAAGAWGMALRVRWLSVATCILALTTLALTSAHSWTKPSGLRSLVRDDRTSIWDRARIESLTVVRDWDGTPEILRAVERLVPTSARLALAVPMDSFLAPFWGSGLSRTVTLVADGASVPASADWLVIRRTVGAVGCPQSWRTVYDGPVEWTLLKRVGPDRCEDPSML